MYRAITTLLQDLKAKIFRLIKKIETWLKKLFRNFIELYFLQKTTKLDPFFRDSNIYTKKLASDIAKNHDKYLY